MPLQKLRIFIIDDEECVRDSLAMHLEAEGHEVITHDTPTACPVFNHHDCHLDKPCADLILVDYQMPEMTGLELLKKLTQKGCRIVPPNRIIITGNATPELKKEIKKMGCQIVQKPLRLDKLNEIIKRASALISTNRELSDLDCCNSTKTASL